jgi:hypothetical protein
VNAITNLAPRLARRVRSARHGITEAPAPALLPAPTFTPTLARTEPIRITGRHAQVRPILPVRIPGPAPATPRQPPADDAKMLRVLDGIRGVKTGTVPESIWRNQLSAYVNAESATPGGGVSFIAGVGEIAVASDDRKPAVSAPGLSRAEEFTADMAHTTGLPIFRRVARKRGWCGLNEEFPAATLSPLGAWRLEEREQDLLDVIAADARACQAVTVQDWRGTGMTA